MTDISHHLPDQTAAGDTLPAEAAVRRAAFAGDALAAADGIQRTGEVFAADELHRYLRARLANEPAVRPIPIKRWGGARPWGQDRQLMTKCCSNSS